MLLWAIVYFVFGSVLMIHWGLAMFTDTGPGEFAREISAEMGVKNNLALTMPSGALMFLFGTVFGFGDPNSVFEIVCGSISAFFLLVMLVSFLPISLPAWMYPEWQLERRRRAQEAARANWEHETGSIVSRGRHAAPPKTATDADGRYGQYAGDAGGEDPLKSSDSLPMRARSPHDDDNGPGDGVNA